MVTKNFLLFTFLSLVFFAMSPNTFAADSLFEFQWGLHNTGDSQRIAIDHYTSGYVAGVAGEDINPPAQVVSTKKVIVAVLDTGIDYNHPQLKNIIVDKGYNVINPAQDATDTHGHGTHIAGIIAAQTGDTRGLNSGLRGVSQNVLILPIKVVQTGPNAPIRPQDTEAGAGTALTENVAKGIEYAVTHGAQVINLSLAWPASIHSQKVDAAMKLARDQNVVIVSSAGNDSTVANVYPCIYENVICVGAAGSDGAFAHYSNYGSMVDLLAPGTAILSTWPMNKAPTTFAGQVGYEFRNGTSMASPFVAGAIAELISRGFSPREATNRILLGARSARLNSQFATKVVGDYSINSNTEIKNARFGNLDLSRALALVPSPLILPTRKAPFDLKWNGVASSITVPVQFTNVWKTSGEVTIQVTVNGSVQSFSLPSIAEGETISIPVLLNLNPLAQESLVHLKASVSTEGFIKNDLDLLVQITRELRADLIPSQAIIKTIAGLGPYTSVRTVVNADQQPRADLVFTRTILNVDQTSALELSLVQDSTLVGKTTFVGLSEDQLLNLYRLPDSSYAAIFTVRPARSARPDFLIKFLNASMVLLREVKVGTDITVLSENFKWAKIKSDYAPLWISIGFSPPLDKAKYDVWDPNAKDLKMPRIFYLDQNDLRSIVLPKSKLPLQILPNGKILLAEGMGYSVQYSVATVVDGKITLEEPLNLNEYRMLVGLDVGSTLTSLKGADSKTFVMVGQSTPGNLRVTALPGQNEASFDSVLSRASVLDSLIQVVGEFADIAHQYYFVQTHYDLKFFTSNSSQTVSTTLNRYSYIPSMIFNRSFFPVVVKDQNQNGMPAIYIPATMANGFVSEVIVVKPGAQSSSNSVDQIFRPANLRFQVTDPTCTEMGNLIAATETDAARQVFICGDRIIQVPLVYNLK